MVRVIDDSCAQVSVASGVGSQQSEVRCVRTHEGAWSVALLSSGQEPAGRPAPEAVLPEGPPLPPQSALWMRDTDVCWSLCSERNDCR